MYIKVEVIVPEDSVVGVVNALNETDILNQGNYDYVFQTSRVRGHFRPIEGANPTVGEIGVVSDVDEVKIEFRIRETDLERTDRLLRKIHPYEEPVINYIALMTKS
ncbi:hypothetical protein O6R05_08165 [Peptoniphilus equinus]|uniref:Uncharacterized protein n=1 Tax=Peptoniphilus equinus TaxID=3016343 RepID=A0ABY7QUD2_9FIRM|nr:hypothetical protein [Peptoniphilus equinus]WBW49966.1 hypothetical protein O6R05_08165 [Peptoniphilus equinus]